MPKRDGQGEAEANTESGEEEAKGGEEMTREEVVQAALIVERWCKETNDFTGCDCPFKEGETCRFFSHVPFYPWEWNLEEFLRNRGLKDD